MLKKGDNVSFRFLDLTAREWFRLLWPFPGYILAGFLGRLFYQQCWPWPDLAFGLFDALAIAGLIGIGLELYSTNFLIERVADDLTERLVGRGLPKKLQSHIREITRTTVVRDQFVKIYTFEEPQEGRVTLDMEISFRVRNFGDSPQNYSPTLEEEAVYDPQFNYLEYGLAGKEPHSFKDEKLLARVDSQSKPNVTRVEGPIKIRLKPVAGEGSEDDTCKVRWRYKVTYPEEYSDLTSFSIATIGCSIILRDLPPTLEFQCTGESMKHAEGSLTWDFDRPFVTDQFVRVRWFRRPKTSR
jgi:hypothetical protein